MPYSITIKKVSREMVTKEDWVGKDDPEADDRGYSRKKVEQDVERTVYTQIVDDLVLTDVINAVNAKANTE